MTRREQLLEAVDALLEYERLITQYHPKQYDPSVHQDFLSLRAEIEHEPNLDDGRLAYEVLQLQTVMIRLVTNSVRLLLERAKA